MMSTMKKMLAATGVMMSLAITVPAAVAQRDSETFRVSNESSYRIDSVYMSRTSSRVWGDDLLAGYMFPNQYLDVEVDPGRYDVKVIDKDRDYCVLKGVNVFEGTVFHLTNMVLLSCEWLSE